MPFSAAVIHAVYVLCYFSKAAPGQIISSSVVAGALQVPPEHAAKILQALASAGLVRSVRGRGGGYLAGRPLRDISLLDVIDALHARRTTDHLRPRNCTCQPSVLCGAHRGLLRASARVRRVLRDTSLAELVRQVPPGAVVQGNIHRSEACTRESDSDHVVDDGPHGRASCRCPVMHKTEHITVGVSS